MLLLVPAAQAQSPVGAQAQSPAGTQAKTPGQAIRKVCTSCHGLELVMDTPRDYNAWHDTVQEMLDRGARGSADELDLVMQFLFENMTTIDVNHADSEALQTVLHATPDQVKAIVARRDKQPFKDLADLEAAVPGLDRPVLEAKKRMIFFQ
jgi:DNA uptake protein ComE-like DNA-binding protein